MEMRTVVYMSPQARCIRRTRLDLPFSAGMGWELPERFFAARAGGHASIGPIGSVPSRMVLGGG